MRAEAKRAWTTVLELEPILFSNSPGISRLEVEENFVEFSNFIETRSANENDLYPPYGKFLELYKCDLTGPFAASNKYVKIVTEINAKTILNLCLKK